MARQYKLRLRDGTVLAVDQAGLRTWLIDDRAMVQPMGTRGWRPLREVLAEEAVMGARTRPEASPRPAASRQTLADGDIPAIPVKPATLDPSAAGEPTPDEPERPAAAKRPTLAEGAPLPLVPPPPAGTPIRAAASAPVEAPAPAPPSPPPVAPPRPAPAPAAPVPAAVPAPPKTVKAPAPAAPVPPAPSAAPAAAPPPRPAPAPVPTAAPAAAAPPPVARPAAPPPPRPATPAPPPAPPVPASAPAPPPRPAAPPRAATPASSPGPLIPEPPPEDAPPLLDDLPIIPFKRLEEDEEVEAPRVSVRVAGPADRLEETDLADQLALVIQQEVAKGHAVVIPEDELEELDLIEEHEEHEEFELDAGAEVPASHSGPLAVPRAPAAPAAPPPPLAAALATGVSQFAGWVRTATASARAHMAAGRRRPAAPGPAAEPIKPPPALSDLPIVPFAKDSSPAPVAGSKRRTARWALAAVLLVAAIGAGVAVFQWIGSGDDRQAVAAPTPPPPTLPPTPKPLPPEVAAAVAQLPHLAPDTVQLLIATSPFGAPDPADVFRRGRASLKRGMAALTPEEAQELAVLERAVLVRLAPSDRERVMAYDRMRAGRDLVPKEDARVLGLVARGTRSLPADQRERLKALSGKAIAAAIAAGAASPDAAAAVSR